MEKNQDKDMGLKLSKRSEIRAHEKASPVPEHLKSSDMLSSFIADSYPWAHGNFEIDNYLNSLNPLPACWVEGDTVYGDVYIGDQNWGTYTRPIFAYLRYVDRYPVPSGSTVQHTFTKTRGFTYSFTESINMKYSVSANIDIVNASSEIDVGFSASQAWSEGTSETWSASLKGPATFYAYQIVLVYAHCATSAWGKCHSGFPHARASQLIDGWRTDMYYLSAIGKNETLTITNPVTPLTWDQVQQYILYDNWNAWSFDYNAYYNNRY